MLRGHEFHYSRIEGERPVETIFAVRRGTGIGEARDGMLVDNALASYLHIHSLGTPQWIQGLVAAARKFNLSRC
jgi:cobyrinic acid a,c-diamide synthase